MKSGQDIIHWLEQGGGASTLRRLAVAFAVLLLTTVFSWKQFHGIPTETTMQQAVMARQLARGEGFTTLVNYPQTYAVMEGRGQRFHPKQPYPELYHAPLYALVLAGVFAVLPDSVWAQRPLPPGPGQPDGWLPDYIVLLVNLALFWIALWLVWRLAKKLFDERVAWMAAVGTGLSVTLCQQVVTLSGLPLLMVLTLAIFDVLAGCELELERGLALSRRLVWRVALLGCISGLLFLTEYSAGLVAAVIGGYLIYRIRVAARWPVMGLFVGALILTTAPWLIRNTMVAGHPLGLAWQNLALKAGDPQAEPAAQRNLATTESPGLDLNKLGNKGLTGMELNLRERLWSGGGLMLTAFFVAGLVYRFRRGPVDRVRWGFGAVLLVLLAGQPFFGSGESLQLPAYYLAPLLIVFGSGFFFVLVDSQPQLTLHWRWAVAALLLLQGLPLARDFLEPKKIHFHYPPYYPNLFMELRRDLDSRFLPDTGVATDVPAGTAWYGQMRVWSKPERLRDLSRIIIDQNIGALLLTPVTLDRPFFTELAAREGDVITLTDAGGWGAVYSGLVTRKFPANFPLNLPPQKLTENMVLLVNPQTVSVRRAN